MLKSKSKIALILLLAIVLISGYSFATAEVTATEEDVNDIVAISDDSNEVETTSNDDSWVKNDLYLCQDNVVVEDIVDGNAFIIGKNVTIKGEIGGDLFVMADKLTIDGGYVYSSVFACANEITVNGIIYDIYAVTNSFTLGEDGYVYRDLKVTSKTSNINGKIKRNALLSSSEYNISDSAVIGGNLEYTASEDISVPEDVVTGEVKRNVEESTKVEKNIGSVILSYVSNLIKTLLYTLVVTLLLIWLAPKFIGRISSMSIAKDFTSLGIGLATFAAVIVGSIILMFTVVGIPLAISSIVLLAILASISFSITSIFFGKLFSKLLKAEGNVKFVLVTLACSIVLWLLCKIPVLGGLITLLITLFGVGATIVNIVSKKENKIEEKK